MFNISEPLIKFNINEITYSIYEVEEIDEEETTIVGLSNYQHKWICIKKLDLDFMIRTLKHELTHIWLWEYGHNQSDDTKSFNCEDVCEIVACSNNFINSVVSDYVNKKLELLKLEGK